MIPGTEQLILCLLVRRDITFRGRDIHSVIKQYRDFVKPSFDEYIAPTQTKADIIIPNGEDSTGR